MSTAHILLELPGVEAGSRYCHCDHMGTSMFDDTWYCRIYEAKLPWEGIERLRCPECLEAEKRATEKPKVTKEQRDEIIALLSDDQIRTARKYFDRILDILGLEVEGEKAKEERG